MVPPPSTLHQAPKLLNSNINLFSEPSDLRSEKSILHQESDDQQQYKKKCNATQILDQKQCRTNLSSVKDK